ncbi:ribonuclease H2 subunit C-like [Asterias amurensis]|uniref:ribonuclease H2 subunit C-like n=1 Tax=Asterias amurensis TaxID=7602 RepID=UPI003AB7512C
MFFAQRELVVNKQKMSLFLNKKSVSKSSVADVHLLGCNIEHTGDARVSNFFKTTVHKNENEMTATFRGRALCGQELDVPTGYTGFVLKEHQKPFMEEEDRTLQAVHQFDKFSYWNLEKTPSANDAVVKAMMWPEIAAAIHGTEETNESQESVKGER